MLVAVAVAPVDGWRPAAADRSVEFKLEVPDQPVIALIDRDRFDQIVVNYLSNAIRYSPSGSTITVSLKRGMDLVVLAVRDEGAGLTAERAAMGAEELNARAAALHGDLRSVAALVARDDAARRAAVAAAAESAAQVDRVSAAARSLTTDAERSRDLAATFTVASPEPAVVNRRLLPVA